MNYFLQGFGVFLGVLAGAAITLLTQWINEKRTESQKLKNLRFEFEFNIKKIETWLEEVVKYRNAVNGDALDTYFGYFDLSRFITITANDMFFSGLLYKLLDHDAIGKLQVIYSEFSLPWENMLNAQITQNKNTAKDVDNWPKFKSKVVVDVNFWENKFKEHKKTLENILTKFKESKQR